MYAGAGHTHGRRGRWARLRRGSEKPGFLALAAFGGGASPRGDAFGGPWPPLRRPAASWAGAPGGPWPPSADWPGGDLDRTPCGGPGRLRRGRPSARGRMGAWAPGPVAALALAAIGAAPENVIFQGTATAGAPTRNRPLGSPRDLCHSPNPQDFSTDRFASHPGRAWGRPVGCPQTACKAQEGPLAGWVGWWVGSGGFGGFLGRWYVRVGVYIEEMYGCK